MSDTILLIEDSTDIRENITELLELAGYTVVTASNGKEGLEAARKTRPSLILCDIMMPELDGYGVLRALENIPGFGTIPFVYLTAKSEKSDFRAAMDLGADDYLTKPFTGDELLRVVMARLKKSRSLREENSSSGNESTGEIQSLDEIAALSANRTVKKIRSKDMVYMEGDTATHLYHVVSGKVKIYKTNEWGKEYITAIVGSGEFFGHLALLNEEEHKQSAMAIENSEIALIPRQDFFQLLYSNKEISKKFIQFLSGDMSESEEKLLHLAYNSARKRVAEALLFISRQYQSEGKDPLSFPANRENISAIAGISPESVSRNLTDFKEENLIVTENGNIRIVDYKKLSSLRA